MKNKGYLLLVTITSLIIGLQYCTFAETDGEMFARGEKQLNSGKYDKAVDTLQSMIEKYRYSKLLPYAIYDQAIAFIELGEYQKAESNFNRIQKEYTFLKDLNTKAQYGLAEVYLKTGRDAKADPIYNTMLTKEPAKAPEVYFMRGLVYYKQKKWDQAITYFKKLIEMFPGDKRSLEARFMLAGIYKEQGKLDKAEEVFKTIPKDSKLSNDMYFNLGELAFKSKEYSKAVKYFRNVKPKSEIYGEGTDLQELARYQIGMAYYEQGKMYETCIVCEDFIERYPKSSLSKDVSHLLVLSYLKLRRKDDAMRAYDNYAKLYPEEAKKLDINIFIGESFFEDGDYSEAVQYYKKQLAESKNAELSQKSIERLGECYFSLKEYDKAEGIYRDYIEKYTNEPLVPHFTFRLAYILAAKGDYAAAVKYYKVLEERFPDSEYKKDVIYNIGWCYSRMKDTENAIVYFKKFTDAFPDSPLVPAAICEVGNTYFNNRQYNEAIEYYRKLEQKYGDSEAAKSAQYRIGICLLYSSKKEEALQALKDFIAKDPTSPYAAEAIKGVYELYLGQKKYSEGIAAFEKMAESNRNQKETLCEIYGCLANLYSLSGNKAETGRIVGELISLYRENRDIVPSETSAYIIGKTLNEENNASKAVEFYTELLKGSGDGALNEVALFGRGQAYLALKSWQEAESDLGELVRKYPNTRYASRAKMGIADSYYYRDILSEAIVYYKEVIDNYKDDTTPEAMFRLGNSYLQRYKYAEALSCFQRVAILYSHKEDLASESLLKAAECQEQLGNKQEAKTLYGKVAEKYPKSEAAVKALEKIGQGK